MQDADFWQPEIASETRPDGTVYVWQTAPLGDYARCMNDRFAHWATTTPDRVWMAERGADGQWQKMTYGAAWAQIRAIGSALLDQGLGPDRPLLILSENSVAHALMALGAQQVGVPSAALAPTYALSTGDLAKLRGVAAQITPGMVFAEQAAPYARALAAVFPDLPVVAVDGALPDRAVIPFARLAATPPSAAMEAAWRAITPDTVAKFLFTSGTTGTPKAVIQTQRLLCSNQKMVAACYRFMEREPPVVVDWAPWNHTASGTKVFNMVIQHGGTYYIDAGKPAPGLIGTTLQNLREIAPTWYFTVPLGYQMMLDEMENDPALRRNFFSRLKLMMYAGAGMSQPVWDRLTRLAEAEVPGGVLLNTGFGATETGPFALTHTERQASAGNLGVPAPGLMLKLVPQDGKYEARFKGPSITPGYWRAPELTAAAFDDEGFYCPGDAVRFADPADPAKGFYFDGRLAENFKLASGTWVAVGALRARLVDDLGGLASDVVIAGENRDTLAALIVPDMAALSALAATPDPVTDPAVRAELARRLAAHAARATGSSLRVTRALLLTEPLDFDRGEMTDKRSINQRAVLRNRAALVERLYSDDPDVIHAERVVSP
ncbi:feruloyl-CoA synthase [Seohaeicola nanhaiensis]|uniref:Feruloyl-CoA synthase n=1 Tax=Seohaeicola nanhaiensis TaxID=1387282 RepID=A0ABV9KI46_9RHOB